MPILGKRGVIGDVVFKVQPAKPTIRHVQMSFFAQPALGTNTVAVAHDQRANHQFRINRRTPNRAVKVGEVVAQIAQIEASINVAQEMIWWNVIEDVIYWLNGCEA